MTRMTRTLTLALALMLAAPLVLLAGCQPHPHEDDGALPAGSEPSARQEVAPASATAATSTSSTCFDPSMSSVCQRSCATKVAYEESDIVKQPGANQGDLTRCVVSGVVIKSGNDNPKVEHSGNSYILCCEGCAKKFRQEPTRFIRS